MGQQNRANGPLGRAAQLLGLVVLASLPLFFWQANVGAQETPDESPTVSQTQTPEPETDTLIRVEVDALTQPVQSGDEFEARVMVDNVDHLAGFDFTIQYDPQRLKFERVSDEGTFLDSGARQDKICDMPETAENAVNVLCNTLGPPLCFGGEAGASGSGLLARAVFRSKGGGSTMLDIINSTLALDDVQPCDPENGAVQQIPHRREGASVQLIGGPGGGISWAIVGPAIAVGVVVVALAASAWYRRRRAAGAG